MLDANGWLRRVCAGAVLGTALAFGGGVASAQRASADELAKRLAAMRAEVEGLSEELAEAKEDARSEVQLLARQTADLQLELDRENVRAAKLRSVLQEKKLRIAESEGRGDDLAPIFTSGVGQLRRYVLASMPFRHAERLGELAKLEEQQRSGALSYGKAVVRLWSFVEDELRMSRESGVFQQTIAVDGEDKLAQVVRVGMVMLYFQTSDGKTGYATRAGGKWQFTASKGEESKQIAKLFASFKKQIRVGLFRVPNALPSLERK